MTQAEKDYEEYIERYSRCRHITPDEAKEHILVQNIKKQYEEEYSEVE